ncbi:hypothetical protein L6164_018857 [Bauhinia variegata]|uniref:Uncharacterized protein n=1 Tax=Bauhinia variegata TaxID=167791 RepID=A0ACB9NDX9_BAUVA|nr:hypothetical protein L6164_018857 [Bauhinia variegata]
MAPAFSAPTKFLDLLLVIVAILICQASSRRAQQTTLVFFLQDVASGPNATVAPITGIRGKDWSYDTFGSLFVVDDPVTLSPNRNSAQVGRAQGLLAASALDGSNVHVLLSIVFDNSQYSGSALEIQGTSRQRENYREVSVVSGTGRFRFARGFASFETMYYDPATSYSIIRFTITLLPE